MSANEAILSIPAPTPDMDLKYGTSKYQFGELRLPKGKAPHPVVIGIHGGYYRARYGLGYFGHLCAALTLAGFATWNIEYRRLGNRGGGWPGTFNDVAAAADYLRTLRDSYSLDLARVVAVGHSAGGQLACWLAARRRIPADQPLYMPEPIRVLGVVSLAGVLDLRRAWELRLSRGVVGQLMGGTPTRYPERYDVTSPMALLPLGLRQILIHGTEDTSVPYDISLRYVEAARAKGDPVELVTQSGAGHFEMVDPRTAEWRSVLRSVEKVVRT